MSTHQNGPHRGASVGLHYDAAYLGRFERRIGANLKASQTGGSIGREEGMTR